MRLGDLIGTIAGLGFCLSGLLWLVGMVRASKGKVSLAYCSVIGTAFFSCLPITMLLLSSQDFENYGNGEFLMGVFMIAGFGLMIALAMLVLTGTAHIFISHKRDASNVVKADH